MTQHRLSQPDMKKSVMAALESNDFEQILTLAYRTRRVLSALVRLAYDKETLVGWRAILAIGKVATIFMENNYTFLRETVRKLLWSLTDESGGIGWSAPEILGEIISADPRKMADLVPIIAELFSVEEETFRPGVLYALMRIAEKEPGLVQPFHGIILSGLKEKDPLAKVYAIKTIRLLKGYLAKAQMEDLNQALCNCKDDKSEAWIYENDGFSSVVVGDLARNNK